jgi:hypothetical protein
MSRAGQSIRQIGRTLKMSPKTIRRILDGTAADHIQRPSRYQDLIPLIRELFVRFDGNVVSIQKELACQYGHNIPYTSLTHLVRNENLRPEKTKRSGTFLYLPGREAQHDTSAHQVTIAGKTVKAQCASMVLAHCRLLFFQYYPRFTRFEAKLFLSAALEYFDGVPQTCIIDNTSVLVAAGSGPDAVKSSGDAGLRRHLRHALCRPCHRSCRQKRPGGKKLPLHRKQLPARTGLQRLANTQ